MKLYSYTTSADYKLRFCQFRWWNERGLAEQLPYSRDRLPECFLWGQGIVADPTHGYAAEMLTAISQIITTVDDTYDVYGTIQELELFTSAVERCVCTCIYSYVVIKSQIIVQ